MWSWYDETNNRAEALNGFIQQLKTANRQKGLLIGDQAACRCRNDFCL